MRLPMRRCFGLASVLLVGCATHIEPTAVPLKEVPNIVSALPKESRLWLSGMAFLDQRLFVSTSIGLLETDGHEIKRLYRWKDFNHMIDGPWSDRSRSVIWVLPRGEGVFARFDGASWQRVDLPRPPGRGFNRGEVFYGLHGVGDVTHFRVESAHNGWRWVDTSTWTIDPTPPVHQNRFLFGIGTFRGSEVHIVQEGGGACSLAPLRDCRYAAYWYLEDKWLPPVPIPIPPANRPVVSTLEGVYVRGSEGQLMHIGIDKVTMLQVPAHCEAIARTSNGQLIASFRDLGVFVLQTSWVKLLDAPYSKSSAEHLVKLAESKGVVALMRSAGRVPKPGVDNQWQYVGDDTLWVSRVGKFERLEFSR